MPVRASYPTCRWSTPFPHSTVLQGYRLVADDKAQVAWTFW